MRVSHWGEKLYIAVITDSQVQYVDSSPVCHAAGLCHDPLLPELPVQPVHRLLPQPPIAAVARREGAGSALPVAPDAQDAGVQQLDAAVALVKGTDHVVGVAGALDALAAAGAVAPGGECVHGPEPGLFGAAERLG